MLGIWGTINVVQKTVQQDVDRDAEAAFARLVDLPPNQIKEAALCWFRLVERDSGQDVEGVGKSHDRKD